MIDNSNNAVKQARFITILDINSYNFTTDVDNTRNTKKNHYVS